MEIAKLQEVFTEKVLSQDVDIQRIHTTAVHTTDNIKTGNEEIREVREGCMVSGLDILEMSIFVGNEKKSRIPSVGDVFLDRHVLYTTFS